MAVHLEPGPERLETVHKVVLPDEIRKRGFSAERQVPVAMVCRGVRFVEGFRADTVVQSKVIAGHDGRLYAVPSMGPVRLSHR